MHAPPKADDPIITAAQLVDCDGLVFGFPTRFGMMAAQFKARRCPSKDSNSNHMGAASATAWLCSAHHQRSLAAARPRPAREGCNSSALTAIPMLSLPY